MTIRFDRPITSAISLKHRNDGSPRAGCICVTPPSWIENGLRFTVQPFADDEGNVVMWTTVEPADSGDNAKSVLDHFKTTGKPATKKPVKPKADLNIGG
tara:strand:+ start:198 stop:494 length:297 start_codon:yes stop_codon:yes gene_type:complete